MQVRKRLVGAVVAVAAALSLGLAPGAVASAPATVHTVAAASVPTPAQSVGKQAAPSVKPGSRDHASKAMAPLGSTKLVAVNANGSMAAKPSTVTPNVGNNSNVDFTTPYQYCQGDLVYTPAYNYSGSTQYVEFVLYANGQSRTFYTSVAAGSYAWPTWYGTTGSWYAYEYVWNGSSYAYDEYKSGTATCSVTTTLNTNTGYTGYVLVTTTNNGTTYASVEENELAPYPSSGTYTGLKWVYPTAGGGSVSTYYYVGTGHPYGIFADLYGASSYTPWYWYGSL